ncbi:heme exporter protein CcmD [Sinorhizobium numidicum]|uniref:Heme exporter protein D n=1 Tax=Sinorhizobium numidicum TaxID=680248 RepID=A0ABY8CZ86_9HYPH|nr:heme exporter protein CcmD [Sinorhizobium numidicum]WEX77300.1 heme exporter protein CcmD [Sinorhizobium numidicum]WEX83959.1 heme exporter protein CcmD [Sinorhizobium numidicum]
MMSHTAYMIASYAVAALTVAGLVLWIIGDGRARQRELKTLEAAGIRRRSAEVSSGEGK